MKKKIKKETKKLKLKKSIVIIGIASVVIVAGLIVGLFFLNKKTDDNTPSGNTTTTTPNTPEEKGIKVVDLNSTSRPYAVMINNHPAARPYHSGLQDAYIVYEIVVEGGMTRYMALFKDQNTERIGSVRSSRHYYLDYALENDAYYVHWGWSPQAQSDISSLKVNNINGLTYEGSYFYRDKTLGVALEHTGLTDMGQLNKAVAKLGYRTDLKKDLLLDYSIDPIDASAKSNTKSANNVSIKYSNSVTTSYVYDEEAQVYKRFVNSKTHSDYVTKEQYTAKNIITYQVANNSLDSYGRQDLTNVGSGKGYFITNGTAIPITWEKSSREAQTIYRYEDGEEIIVNDGNTYIQIQPKGQTLTFE